MQQYNSLLKWIKSGFHLYSFLKVASLSENRKWLRMKSVTLWPNDHQQYDWHDKRNKLKQQHWKRLHNAHTHTHTFTMLSHQLSSNHFSISYQSKTNRSGSKFRRYGIHKTTGRCSRTKIIMELFVIEVFCSCNRFSMEEFFFSSTPSFYRLVGIFKSWS